MRQPGFECADEASVDDVEPDRNSPSASGDDTVPLRLPISSHEPNLAVRDGQGAMQTHNPRWCPLKAIAPSVPAHMLAAEA